MRRNYLSSKKILKDIQSYFQSLGHTPFAFQTDAWENYLNGKNSIINVPTGMGKTLASLAAAMVEVSQTTHREGIQILYISPLRSLTTDLERNLEDFNHSQQLQLKIATRTGDTKAHERAKLKKNSPDILLTTPESFNLMLVDQDYAELFKSLRLLVIDEWHVLISQKRGVLLQLNVAWLNQLNPDFLINIMSATLADPMATAYALAPQREFQLVTEEIEKIVETDILLPDEIATFPWRGHLGSAQLDNLLQVLNQNESTLIFTNTRSQAEKWYQFLIEKFEPLSEIIAVHHSSIESSERSRVEKGLVSGEVKWVVCTSSLDLGIDFPKVEKVIQIGSAKSVSRLLQRAGRAGHKPGGISKILFVPTHAFEIFEYLALEMAIDEKKYDEEIPPVNSYDVLAQFLISFALLNGLDVKKAFQLATSTHSFKDLTYEQFERILSYIENGGQSLKRYPQYHRVKKFKDKYYITDKKMRLQHLMNMGTITSHPSVRVKFKNGKYLGTLEDIYVAKLKKGDVFQFAGRKLKYVLMRDTTLYVELAAKKVTNVPRWAGGILPLSTLLCEHLRYIFDDIDSYQSIFDGKLSQLISAQKSLSQFPKFDELLIEFTQTKEGNHLFLFPFEGRAVHEGMGMLLASRYLQRHKITLTLSVNEYGIELLGPGDWFPSKQDIEHLLSDKNVSIDILKANEYDRLSQRKFGEIAQISGLIPKNFPGNRRSAKNLQMNANLLYNVFSRFEPDNIFYRQAEIEANLEYLNFERLMKTLHAINRKKWISNTTLQPTPFSFPLIIERVSATVSGEELKDRVLKILKNYDRDTKQNNSLII